MNAGPLVPTVQQTEAPSHVVMEQTHGVAWMDGMLNSFPFCKFARADLSGPGS